MRHRLIVVSALALAGWACAPDQSTQPLPGGPSLSVTAADRSAMVAYLDGLNAALQQQGASYRAGYIEYYGEGGGDAAAATLLQRNVGNRRLSADFVPFDDRRADWSGPVTGPNDDITFAVDGSADAVPVMGSVTAAQATTAIRNSMATWDAATCSGLSLTEVNTGPLDLGLAAFLDGLGGGPFLAADIQHAGWGDVNFSPGIIAATITFIFVEDDPPNDPTDIDGNFYLDAAFREIYYDTDFTWNIGGGAGRIDIETVSLHEVGHALSHGHFGNLFLKDGFLMASPRAVMNAFYGGALTSLLGTDEGGHCNNWANWPIN
jgi:hypothetical protein